MLVRILFGESLATDACRRRNCRLRLGANRLVCRDRVTEVLKWPEEPRSMEAPTYKVSCNSGYLLAKVARAVRARDRDPLVHVRSPGWKLLQLRMVVLLEILQKRRLMEFEVGQTMQAIEPIPVAVFYSCGQSR
jgi:hypothetical protein